MAKKEKAAQPAEETQETEAETTAAAETEADETQSDEGGERETLAQEKARLQQEREEFEAEKARHEASRRAPIVERPKVTAAYLRSLDERSREYVEQQTGMSFDAVLSNIEAQESKSAESQRVAALASVFVRDAIDDVVEQDPQLAKSKTAIREYLADFPSEDKADPVKLKALMKKAVIYARGKNPAPPARREAAPQREADRPETETETTAVNDPKKGDIKPGVYSMGEFKIEIQDLVDPKVRAKVKHPEHVGGIRIPSNFDEAPRFR